MWWNIGSTSVGPAILPALPAGHLTVDRAGAATCPIDHAPARPAAAPAKCPVDHTKLGPSAASSSRAAASAAASAAAATTGPAKCPVDHASLKAASGSSAASGSALNPLNHMPALSTAKAPGQVLDLPLERTSSTIPRPKTADDPDAGGVWEYPSPQQFYNALVRKGWETPEDSIEMVVDIHNFINEMAWEEVMKWERRMPGGEDAMLARFQGRPGELSPKARFHLWAGTIFPSKFNTEPPFDRHDWIVTRPLVDSASTSSSSSASPSSPQAEVSTRYVIDYYSAPPDEDGNPVFSLDVRPALDTWAALALRVRVAAEEWMAGDGQ
ncbi:holocytochrome c synthase [Cryptotrichosporon argae]